MPITQDSILLRPSRVMADVPEGGGGPAAGILVSGKSNNIFADISGADRAGGALNLRQVHLSFNTQDTDTALGVNVIVGLPSDDPNAPIVLMPAEDDFATRQQEMSRLEAGFVSSGVYPGYLFGNHLAGQTTLMVAQNAHVALPPIGARLVLVYREGYADQHVQYVSVQRIASNVLRGFLNDSNVEYHQRVLGLEIGQALNRNYPGFDASQRGVREETLNQRTKLRETVWSPVARYYGTKRLRAPAALGTMRVQADGIYERIVPSAEAETPIPDALLTAQIAAVEQAGGLAEYEVRSALTPQFNLFVGGGITPGSLRLHPKASPSALVTDEGGKLMRGGEQVGVVDYANGVLTAYVPIVANAQTLVIRYAPAIAIQRNAASIGIPVTAQNRRQNYVATLPWPIVPGTLQVAWSALGRWYALHEDGSGGIAGLDATQGAGNYNATTRTLTVTLGAIPDVSSAIIFTFVVDESKQGLGNGVGLQHGRFAIPINSNGELSTEPGSSQWALNHVQIYWVVDDVEYVAWDDGRGGLVGAAAGHVYYQQGRALVIPHVLPPKGTPMLVRTVKHTQKTELVSWTTVDDKQETLLAEDIEPGTFALDVVVPITVEVDGQSAPRASTRDVEITVTDSAEAGDNNLYAQGYGNLIVGAIDRATRKVALDISADVIKEIAANVNFELTEVGRANVN